MGHMWPAGESICFVNIYKCHGLQGPQYGPSCQLSVGASRFNYSSLNEGSIVKVLKFLEQCYTLTGPWNNPD
jgi:hypothetical protein